MDVYNYRLITLVSSVSKIMERMIYDQITVFLEKFHIFTLCQHGFRDGKFIETASIQLLDTIYSSLDKGKYVVMPNPKHSIP